MSPSIHADGTNLDHALAVALDAAHQAAKLQRFHLEGPLEIDVKSSATDLVTQVDRACETVIREVIGQAFPDHVVLGEERGQEGTSSTHRWIVDPLDGTLNYAHGFPFFCTSIALEVDGVVQLGVVVDPVRDESFTAVKGRGSFRNGRPVHVTNEGTLIRSLFSTGFAYVSEVQHENLAVFERMLPKARGLRRAGAAALDLAYVACGRLDGFWELDLNPWDVAAGWLLVEEAGGRVTSGDGAPYRFGPRSMVATNGAVHDAALEVLALPT